MNESITSDTSDQSSDPNLNSTNTGGLKISVKTLYKSPLHFTKMHLFCNVEKYFATNIFTLIYFRCFTSFQLLIEEGNTEFSFK